MARVRWRNLEGVDGEGADGPGGGKTGLDGRAVARTVVIQPLPGLGDMVQLIPALRALARADESGRVDLMTVQGLPAAALFAGEGYIGRVCDPMPRYGTQQLYPIPGAPPQALRRRQPVRDNLRRLGELADMARLMRQGRYHRAIILGTTWRHAAAARLAGIPEIAGYGSSSQTPLLTRSPTPDGGSVRGRAATRLGAAALLLEHLGLRLVGAPTLTVDPSWRAVAQARHAGLPGPWLAVAVGSAERIRVWPPARTAAVLDALALGGHRTQFVLGSKVEGPLVEAVIAACRVARPVACVGLPIEEVMGLLASCDAAFCTDSGLMNVAAALGVPTHALFATMRPYDYWDCLEPIVPPGGLDRVRGVDAIPVDVVLAHLRQAGLLAQGAASAGSRGFLPGGAAICPKAC